VGKNPAVHRDEFWATIEQSRRLAITADQVAARVVRRLARRPPEEIVSWGRHYDHVAAESFRPLLWAAAYLINGGCSDDGFDYFRGWLVTRGRRTWVNAVADPDSLVEVIPTNRVARLKRVIWSLQCEDMLSVAPSAYERGTGDPEGYWAAAASDDDPRSAPEDEWFDFDDESEMRARLPRLSKALLGRH
jgi:Protein of unknown function (DUF4240)